MKTRSFNVNSSDLPGSWFQKVDGLGQGFALTVILCTQHCKMSGRVGTEQTTKENSWMLVLGGNGRGLAGLICLSQK